MIQRKMRSELIRRNAKAREIALQNREADTVYWINFVPIDEQALPPLTTFHPTNDDPWRIVVANNPESDSDTIQKAIAIFEHRHNICSWREISARYTFGKIYFP